MEMKIKRIAVELLIVALLILSFAEAQEEDFSVSPPIIKSAVKEGSSINYPVSIINSGPQQKFSIYSSSRLEFISFSKDELIIGEDDTGSFDIIFDSGGFKGVYVGSVIISDENSIIKMPVVLEVESKDILFDVKARMAPRAFEIASGEDLAVDIILWDIAASDNNAEIEYYISDMKGNVVLSQSEKLKIDDTVSLRKNFEIPEDLEEGNYVLYAYAKQGSSFGTTSLIFYVGQFVNLSPKLEFEFNDYFYFIGGVLFVLIAGIFIFSYVIDKKLLHAAEWKKRIFDIRRMDFSNINQTVSRLIHQKELLEEAYEKGYIQDESYKEGNEKLGRMIRGLKRKLL